MDLLVKYRSEIDGLRAFAVSGVVLSHAGFGIVQGGFVGVDVFFVISGYLITTILMNDIKNSRFSLSEFYFRRARRILPVLFVIFMASLPFSWWLLTPSQFVDYGRSLAASALFISNVHFWESTGYFDSASELIPLLHTWSLSVEEQFYLLFPLILLFISKFSLKYVGFILGSLAFLSLCLAIWGSQNLPEQNFFFTFSRFWEILVGSLCGIAPKIRSRPWHSWISFVGLALIVISMLTFTKATPTPSVVTLIPVAGAAVIIIFGQSGGWCVRFLSLRIFTGIGMISYSIYLWHQPLFAFARHFFVVGVPLPVMVLLNIFLVFVSYFTWRYVEQPFRNFEVSNKRFVFRFSGIGIIGFSIIGFCFHVADFSKYRYTVDELRLLNYDVYYKGIIQSSHSSNRLNQCSGDSNGYFPDLENCFVEQDPDMTLIWGDSHAQALASGWPDSTLGIVSFSFGAGCPPVVGYSFVNNPDCELLNAATLSKVASARPNVIILHANWLIHLTMDYPNFSNVSDLKSSLFETVSIIKSASPSSKIVLIGGVPQWGDGLPTYIYRLGFKLDSVLRLALPNLDRQIEINTALGNLAHAAKIEYIDPISLLCLSGECIATTESDGTYYPIAWDYGHLTVEGARYLLSLTSLKL